MTIPREFHSIEQALKEVIKNLKDSIEIVGGKSESHFRKCSDENDGVNYAYHLDATLYADFLKTFSMKHGAKHVEGLIEKVIVSSENGFIKSLFL